LYFNCYNELALGWVIACEQVNHLGM